ncbi:hypothetical protein [Desulfosediminicola ganghwensis]|uniref:hypothetical protein n=1 Tax=Desulfosediminicola ganghwensis TaxID=2569540 RepID=UPI0010AC8383|nr:hypothetical protein [Desulfosediminicola ganghwensis]
MALPKSAKRIVPDISSAVQRAAGSGNSPQKGVKQDNTDTPNRGGRPSPRAGNSVRQTLLLTEDTAERLTMAYAGEQNKRRKLGQKLDKSFFIEEMVVAWLDKNNY